MRGSGRCNGAQLHSPGPVANPYIGLCTIANFHNVWCPSIVVDFAQSMLMSDIYVSMFRVSMKCHYKPIGLLGVHVNTDLQCLHLCQTLCAPLFHMGPYVPQPSDVHMQHSVCVCVAQVIVYVHPFVQCIELVSAYVYTSIPPRNHSGRASATGKVGKMWLGTAVDCLWSYSCRLST